METVEPGEAVAALAANPAADNPSDADATSIPEEDGPPAFSETAESAFLADARERGEVVRSPEAAADQGDDVEAGNGGPLPRLDELVNRIPADVRETLDDLFRARFVAVRRIPKKALKS